MYSRSSGSYGSNGFDRFSSSRKSSIYERPSTYKTPGISSASESSSLNSLTNKYRSFSDNTTSSSPVTTPSSLNFSREKSPFISSTISTTSNYPSDSLGRRSSISSNYYRTSDNGDRNSTYSSYKSASRSNSRNLFGNSTGEELSSPVSPSVPESPTDASKLLPTFSRTSTDSLGRSSNRNSSSSYLTDRIASTLARHGKEIDQNNDNIITVGKIEMNNSTCYEPDRRSNGWRCRFQVDEMSSDTSKVIVTSRATSPQPDKTKQVRTRIARTTESTIIDRKKPSSRLKTIGIQTDPVTDSRDLKIKYSSPPNQKINSFDYFDSVKKSLEQAPTEKLFSTIKQESSEEDEDDFYKVEKAPMMQLLPNNNATIKSSLNNIISKGILKNKAEHNISPEPVIDNSNGHLKSESEYESEYEDENIEEENYETKADKILDEEEIMNESALDYIDEEEDEDKPILSPSMQRKERGAFISGTIDIDILLGKEKASTNLIDTDSDHETNEIVMTSKESNTTYLNTIPKISIESFKDDEKPWWLNLEKSKSKLDVRDNEEVENDEDIINDINGNEHVYEDENDDDQEEEEEEIGEEGEEEQEEEEDGDWEYYYSDEENDEDKKEIEIILETTEDDKRKHDNDERCPWIISCLNRIIPTIPSRKAEDNEEEIETDDEGTGEDNIISGRGSPRKVFDQEKGYREWLQESSQMHEDEEQDKLNSEDVIVENCEIEYNSKAEKLVHKIKKSTESDLKRVLFSLKKIFQDEKELVYEFIQVGGLSVLIELGDNEESQLQNLILRALGQIMLYVDGMNGVMENRSSIQFLYKLTASSNPLVCKTGLKLLLVFVEYVETNCILLIQAINALDKESGVIPWNNIITNILQQEDVDADMYTFALTLINKTLYGIPDQDNFYNQTDYMEELGIENCFEIFINMDPINEGLMQQVQLYNVALKQEDGEPVTEHEIIYIDEEASEEGLRSTLRLKSEVTSSRTFHQRKSLRYKAKKIAEVDLDSTGDIEGVTIRDVEAILGKHGLPTSRSGVTLNALSLNGFLDKTRKIFVAKINKGEEDVKDNDVQSESDDEAEGIKQWENMLSNFNRTYLICDLDFTDLQDTSPMIESKCLPGSDGIPPVPPPPPPPPPPAPPMAPPPPPPPLNGISNNSTEIQAKAIYKKHKKTVKLFWKEIREINHHSDAKACVWDELPSVDVDIQMIEYLFEYRGKELVTKENKPVINTSREIIVLDHKRSNAINIAMTKLPPPRIIKSAIFKMDSTIMNREGVEKLLTMLPTDEEIERIQEARESQPEIPLGTAEQFLITLSSISGLESRLRLWAFKMEFEVVEKEVCEPLMDLKIGISSLRNNQTFKMILKVLLNIGNFLNSSTCKGFQLDYLVKVPEVKDTVHKHSLLYHMTYWVIENCPESSDLYSEIGPLIRASRTDFNELEKTLRRIETECKYAWDCLKVISKHDNKDSNNTNGVQTSTNPSISESDALKEFLMDAGERIVIMTRVYKKIIGIFENFLRWMGIPGFLVNDYPVHITCKILSEFSLEYRTTRERVIQTIQKKKLAREKKLAHQRLAKAQAAATSGENNVNGEISNGTRHRHRHRRSHKTRDEQEHQELQQLLGTNIDITDNGTLRRRKKHHHHRHRKTHAILNEDGSVIEGNGDQEIIPVEKQKKSRRHRSSLMGEGTLPITDEMIKSFNTANDMERGLLETLINTSDSSSMKRHKERRKKSDISKELKRSRTRENMGYVDEE